MTFLRMNPMLKYVLESLTFLTMALSVTCKLPLYFLHQLKQVRLSIIHNYPNSCQQMQCRIINMLSCIHSAVGVDFNVSGSSELRFPSSVTSSGEVQCVNITIEDDMIVEGNHTISLGLAPGLELPFGLIDFVPMSSVILIEDNDGKNITYDGLVIRIVVFDLAVLHTTYLQNHKV